MLQLYINTGKKRDELLKFIYCTVPFLSFSWADLEREMTIILSYQGETFWLEMNYIKLNKKYYFIKTSAV